LKRKAADKPALLAAEGPSIRGLVQSGGTVQATELLDALPNLEIISVFGVGYDGVPVDYCKKRGIKVTNTPDVLTEDVADTAVALLLSALAVWRRERVLAPVASDAAWVAALSGGLTAGVLGALSEDSGPVLLVVAVFILGCVLAYLWGKPSIITNRIIR